MTTSLYSNVNGDDLFSDCVDDFKEELSQILIKLAPKYLRMVEEVGDFMLKSLLSILSKMNNSLFLKFFDYQKLLETKIIEWFSFWFGYYSMGGNFPIISKGMIFPNSNNLNKNKDRKFFVVIPIGSENNKIWKILSKSLRVLQKHEQIINIYCVCDGVTSSKKIIKNFSKVVPLSTSKRSGPATARNIGLMEGFTKHHSDVLLLDSDIELTGTSLLDNLIQSFIESGSFIACPLICGLDNTWFDEYHNVNGTLNGRYLNCSQNQNLLFGTTSCMFVSKEIYNSGILFSTDFNEAAGEDIDFCLRAIIGGFQIAPLDNIVVPHWYGYEGDEISDLNHFQIRFERYGRGEFLLSNKHPYYHNMINYSCQRITW